MGFHHTDKAYGLTAGNPGTKAVLLALAYRACDSCGLCWPGVPWIAARAELGETRVRAALQELIRAGTIVVHRFPNGGRGISTEYIVLPSVMELSTAPCGECASRMRKPPRGDAFDNKPIATRMVSVSDSAKGIGNGVVNPSRGDAHQSENHHQSGSPSARVAESRTSPGQRLDIFDPANPDIPPEARNAIQELRRTLGMDPKARTPLTGATGARTVPFRRS